MVRLVISALMTLSMSAIIPVAVAAEQLPPSAKQTAKQKQLEEKVPAGCRVFAERIYRTIDGHDLALDVMVPAPAPGSTSPPLVIWVHGGGWKAGNRDGGPAFSLLRHGIAVACIDYRLSGVAAWPAQIHDCKAALRWLRTKAPEFGFDGTRIGAWGSSAGGHLVAMLGTSAAVPAMDGDADPNTVVDTRVQAVCDWYGPTDLLRMNEHATAVGVGSEINHDAPNSPESQLLGGPLQQQREAAVTANPMTYLDRSDPPFLIMHGEQDRLVSIAQSAVLYEALQQAGIASTFVRIPEAGHGGKGFTTEPVEVFFRRYLLDAKPAERP